MFWLRHDLTLNRVHDVVRVREGGDSITLRVDADANRMVAGLSHAQDVLKAVPADATAEQRQTAIMYFATVIFGKEQAEKLLEFYNNAPDCVLAICGQYFSTRLMKKITKAQKKAKT